MCLQLTLNLTVFLFVNVYVDFVLFLLWVLLQLLKCKLGEGLHCLHSPGHFNSCFLLTFPDFLPPASILKVFSLVQLFVVSAELYLGSAAHSFLQISILLKVREGKDPFIYPLHLPAVCCNSFSKQSCSFSSVPTTAVLSLLLASKQKQVNQLMLG